MKDDKFTINNSTFLICIDEMLGFTDNIFNLRQKSNNYYLDESQIDLFGGGQLINLIKLKDSFLNSKLLEDIFPP